ncbi:MAG: type II toxin-antitoxin system RelE/ParE family toxin [Bacteroidetes bacterium]|nr:type II toxin-antitoxin system RelE/ParE family toxin [Bacteroidota bacterium]MBU1719826.1 type II toxin-antitoxin system RelE/ParE family toxin [Bacteroidota bacterium]
MEISPTRKTLVYGTEFWAFYNSCSRKVQAKIDWVIGLVRTMKVMPEKFFKHIEGADGLFEIRVKSGSNIFRIFCFFDQGNLVILLNGFQKKTNKTPGNEITRAMRLKQRYYDERKGK